MQTPTLNQRDPVYSRHRSHLLRLFLKKQGQHTLTIVGTSMRPWLKEDDLVVVVPSDSYRVGDIIVFESGDTLESGENSRPDAYIDRRLLIHRIVCLRRDKDQFLVRCKGDNCRHFDPQWIRADQILGRIQEARRAVLIYARIRRRDRWRDICLGRLSYCLGWLAQIRPPHSQNIPIP